MTPTNGTIAEFDERVDQYLLGRMNEQQALEFEIEYLDNPQLLAEVEMVEQLIHGLKLNAGEAFDTNVSYANNANLQKTNIKSSESFMDRISRFFGGFSVPQAAFGAVAAAVLIVPVMLYQQGEHGASPIQTTSVYVLGQQRVRSAAAVPDANIETIELALEQTSFTLGIATSPIAGIPEPYTLKVYNQNNKLIWQQDSLYPDYQWNVYVNLATNFIDEGDYRYELQSDNGEDKSGMMRIKKL
ncbi:hypothetical protein [Sessilibacter sp. MAH4]